MTKTIKLTTAEINHILTLISMNEKDRWVYGNTEQYWKRLNKIKDKLMKQEGE